MSATRPYAVALATLTVLFLGRVAGQVVVGLWAPAWLPPFDEWDSGLIPYPLLLLAQAVILVLQTKVCADFARGAGPFVRPRPLAARRLRIFAYVYVSVMALRYVVTMWLRPEDRWLTGTIPIWFHFVLAGFLLILCRFHLRLPPDERDPS